MCDVKQDSLKICPLSDICIGDHDDEIRRIFMAGQLTTLENDLLSSWRHARLIPLLMQMRRMSLAGQQFEADWVFYSACSSAY